MNCHRLLGFFLAVMLAVALSACSSAEDRARGHFDRATSLIAQGDLPRASLELRNTLRLQPGYPEAQFSLGTVQERQGDFSAAMRSFMAVSEQFPQHVQARVRLSYILLAADQLADAAKYIEQAAALAPEDPAVLTVRGVLAFKQGNAEEAVRLAEAALQTAPEFTDALMLLASERMMNADPLGALAQLDRSSAPPEENMGLQMLRLSALEAASDLEGVEELFTRLVELSPGNVALREGLVRWYLEKGRATDAEKTIRQYVVANASDDRAILYLVSFLLEHGGHESAISELSDAIAARLATGGDAFELRLALAQLKAGAGGAESAAADLSALVEQTSEPEQKNRALVQLAQTLGATNRPEAALEAANAVLEADPRNVEALGIRASLSLVGGETASAIEDILAALNEAPDNATLHGLLAEAYERDGSVVLAEEQFTKALDLSGYTPATGIPVARFFLKHGKTQQAIRTLENVYQRTPDNREVLGLLGELRLATQDWVGAEQIAEALRQLGEADENMTADRIASAALLGLNRYDDSIALLQSTISTSSNQSVVLPNLIASYVQAGKPEVALEYLKSLINKDPKDTQPLILLGFLHLRQGEQEQAEHVLRQAAEASDNFEGEIALAQFYMSLSRPDDAEEVVLAALQQSPDNRVLKLLIAAIYERGERFEDAIGVYEDLLEEDPTAIAIANDLASLLSERRTDPESLERAFQIAQRLRGSDIPQYQDTLGWILHLRGDFDAALPLLRSAAGRLANVALVHYHLGMTYAAQGQQTLARTSLERALTISPPLLANDAEKARAAIEQLTTAAPVAAGSS